jgi:agmatinase
LPDFGGQCKGEHTVSLGVLQGYREFTDQPITVVQMDAHGDLRSSYDGMEIAHGTVFFHVSKFYQVRQFGIRVMCEEERDFLAESKQVICMTMPELRKKKNWMDELIQSIKTDKVYLSVDVDGFDPSIMPATGTPVPGGIEWDEAMEFYGKLFKAKEIVGADFVELAPQAGMHGASFLTAMMIYKFIGMGMKRL